MGSIWSDPPPPRRWVWALILGWLALLAVATTLAWAVFGGTIQAVRPL